MYAQSTFETVSARRTKKLRRDIFYTRDLQNVFLTISIASFCPLLHPKWLTIVPLHYPTYLQYKNAIKKQDNLKEVLRNKTKLRQLQNKVSSGNGGVGDGTGENQLEFSIPEFSSPLICQRQNPVDKNAFAIRYF